MKTLILIDVQNDFMPDGQLPVSQANNTIPVINKIQRYFDLIVATQDWHPPNHCSFLGQRDHLYPPHCVAGTPGADFLPELHTDRFSTIWRKGYDRDFEAYAVTAQHPGFVGFLRATGITSIVVCGIATNICCFFAARDLRQAGFEVGLVEDASAGIDVPTAGLFQAQARSEGLALGIRYTTVAEILANWSHAG